MLVHRPFQSHHPVTVKGKIYDGFHTEFSPIKVAVLFGNYDLMWQLIDSFGVDIDYYCPPYDQMTIPHVIAKYRTQPFDDFEKDNVRRLILKTKRVDWQTRMGRRSFIELANLFKNPNYEFLLQCGSEVITKKRMQLLAAQLQGLEKIGLHKNYFDPVLKYI